MVEFILSPILFFALGWEERESHIGTVNMGKIKGSYGFCLANWQ